jgi:hypothetical protein
MKSNPEIFPKDVGTQLLITSESAVQTLRQQDGEIATLTKGLHEVPKELKEEAAPSAAKGKPN